MSDLSIYDFKDQPVRIADQDGALRFVAPDICRILQLGNVTKALLRLQPDEKGLITIQTPGGKQEVNVVTESGLYALIFTSRKPAAQEFRKWVTHEVLPAVRKTGRYELDGATEARPLNDPEVECASVAAFTMYAQGVREWPVSRKIYFALSVRRWVKGFGIEWRTEFSPSMGRVLVVPLALLHWAAQEIVRGDQLMLNGTGAGDDQEVEELIFRLSVDIEPGEKRQLSFQEVFNTARSLGLFGLSKNSIPDQRLKCVLGKRLGAAAMGKRYGDIIFRVVGNHKHRQFQLKRLASETPA